MYLHFATCCLFMDVCQYSCIDVLICRDIKGKCTACLQFVSAFTAERWPVMKTCLSIHS